MMEEKRDALAEKLMDVIGKLYERFDWAAARAEVEMMLAISDRITKAAEVLAKLHSIHGLEEQIAMLEKVLLEAAKA